MTKVYPDPARHLLGWIAAASLVAILALSLTGCSSLVSAEVKDQILQECAIHDGVLRLWPTLTPDQRLRAYQLSRANWYAQRFNVLGTPLPEDLRPESREMKQIRKELGITRPVQTR